jgi:hypothetical protein
MWLMFHFLMWMNFVTFRDNCKQFQKNFFLIWSISETKQINCNNESVPWRIQLTNRSKRESNKNETFLKKDENTKTVLWSVLRPVPAHHSSSYNTNNNWLWNDEREKRIYVKQSVCMSAYSNECECDTLRTYFLCESLIQGWKGISECRNDDMSEDHFPEFIIKILSTQIQSFEQRFDCSIKINKKKTKINWNILQYL